MMAPVVVIVLVGVGLVLRLLAVKRTYEAIGRGSDDEEQLIWWRKWCQDELMRARMARQRQALRRPDRGS